MPNLFNKKRRPPRTVKQQKINLPSIFCIINTVRGREELIHALDTTVNMANFDRLILTVVLLSSF